MVKRRSPDRQGVIEVRFDRFFRSCARHGWLSKVPLAAAALGLACTALAQQTEVRLVFVGDENSSAYRGAQQGLAEAQAQGEFLGQRYVLTSQPPSAAAPAAASAIIAAVEQAELTALANANPEIPVLNVGRTDDALRRACRANLLHVLPSDEMAAAAVKQWQTANPGATHVTARAWHPSFEKYAAAQLNKRYQQAFKSKMDDAAWAGWAAVKLVSDMVAREQTTQGPALLDALRSRLAFDGQKGVDMSFRNDGQLRQPLLLIANDEIVGEAPVRGVAEIEDLDSLGRVECAK